ncbi:HNH endonuclease [Caballeronia cordobensis]|uniref:HNH endonuclease n=1 Tax=Caballeronia cordobensis TaxID=1353886 RepID=UPI00045EE372|nr:putative membrane protein [Burkholderia sp. RPE67]
MALEHLNDRAAVLAAVDEFDRLGRPAFLEKYGFKEARDYFLQIDGRRYDSKAIAGAAHGYQYPDSGPLKARDFSGGAATVQRKLESLGFRFASLENSEGGPSGDAHARASDLLNVDRVYTREDLKRILDTQDATINTGVFRPRGFNSILLFVTEQKTADRVQYIDQLEGDTLHWQGQNAGRTDDLIIEHRARGVELLLFYRTKKYEYAGAGFRYEGPFDYVSHHGALPASFVMERAGAVLVRAQLKAESEAEAQMDGSGAFDPSGIEDARKKTFSGIVLRQGQPAFRKKLLEAYEGRCALTDCPVEAVLEAAHICGYRGPQTNHVQNGLLLRSDLHTLYDRMLIAIDPASYKVSISLALKDSEYAGLDGHPLRLPNDARCHPSREALLTHWMHVRSIREMQS